MASVFVMVGTDEQARRAIACADGLIAQAARPADTRWCRGRPTHPGRDGGAGAAGVVAGTRFLLTDEARAPRIPAPDPCGRQNVSGKVVGLGWPAPHRVVANAATRRWCHDDGRVKLAPGLINAGSGALARLGDRAIMPVLKMQTPRLPMFSPVAPTIGMPESAVDHTALYAGETVLRMTSVIPARQAVTELAPR
jgi:NAD(P)H-dependent flavin oxidoreductase YrpB (nitropropane dioxygenase family)